MSLRVAIQKKLIELFRAGTFYAVTYDSVGIPSVGEEKLIPSIVCNEVSASIGAKADGQGLAYQFTGWSFVVICGFGKEVDFSEFVLKELKDLNVNESGVLVTVTAGNTVIVKHPTRQGSESGTELQFTFQIKTKR